MERAGDAGGIHGRDTLHIATVSLECKPLKSPDGEVVMEHVLSFGDKELVQGLFYVTCALIAGMVAMGGMLWGMQQRSLNKLIDLTTLLAGDVIVLKEWRKNLETNMRRRKDD
jgi:hypothetical protein